MRSEERPRWILIDSSDGPHPENEEVVVTLEGLDAPNVTKGALRLPGQRPDALCVVRMTERACIPRAEDSGSGEHLRLGQRERANGREQIDGA